MAYDKSRLRIFADYVPGRQYMIVEFKNGLGRVWYQIAYKRFGSTYYVTWSKRTEVASMSGVERFDTREDALAFLESGRKWKEDTQKSATVTSKVVDVWS